VPRAGREIEFRSRCLDDGRKSKSHFNIYLLSQLHIYLYICGVILQNLDWVQLKFDLCQFLCQERPLLVQNFHPVEVPANFKWGGRLMNDESVKKIPIIDLEQTRMN
jgi:hypothetical protein